MKNLIDEEDYLEEIERVSKRGYSKGTHIIKNFVEGNWCEKDELILAYKDITKPKTEVDNRVTVFFQIPYEIKVASRWIKFNYLPDFPLEFKLGSPYLWFKSKTINGKIFTQILISFQLWDKMRILYPDYLQALENNFHTIDVPYSLSSTGRLSPEHFEIKEYGLGNMLLMQSRIVLEQFIKIYKIIGIDNSVPAIKHDLFNFFLMVKNGRLVKYSKYKFEDEDILENSEHILDDKREKQRYQINLKKLENWLKTNRPPSVYEEYLLETSKLLNIGLNNLAIVQSVMILEWFANVVLEKHLVSYIKKNFHSNLKLERYLIKKISDTSKNHLNIENKLENYDSFTRPETSKELEKAKQGLKKQLLTEEELLKIKPKLKPALKKGNLPKTNLLSIRNDIIHNKEVNPPQYNYDVVFSCIEIVMDLIGAYMNHIIAKDKEK